jgi:U6 snRNA-associated Sm-like protein LSm7
LPSLGFGSHHPQPLCPSPDPDDQYKLTEDTRQLGLVVCRGTSVVLICPQDGMEAIPNPFIQQQDA